MYCYILLLINIIVEISCKCLDLLTILLSKIETIVLYRETVSVNRRVYMADNGTNKNVYTLLLLSLPLVEHTPFGLLPTLYSCAQLQIVDCANTTLNRTCRFK